MADDFPGPGWAANPTDDQVTVWLDQLRSDDSTLREDARRRLDETYAAMMKAAILQRLNSRIRQRIGASDVYQQLMNTFFQRMRLGEYDLPDRDALLALLFDMMKKKVSNARLHHRRRKRDVDRELPLADEGEEGDGGTGLQQLAEGTQTPREPITRPYRRNLPRVGPIDAQGDSSFANKDLIQLLTCGADQQDAVEAEEVYDLIKADLDQKPPLGLVFDRILGGFSDEDMAVEIGKTVARVRQLTNEIRLRMLAIGIAPEFQDPFASGTH